MNLNRLKDLPASPGIMGMDKYVQAAVLIPLIELKGEFHILFQKRAEHIRQGSEICFPGGLKEEGESFFQAAIRETHEELGIAPERIEILGQMDTLIAAMGTIIKPFVGKFSISNIEELTPNLEEVEKIFTLPLSSIHVEDFKEHLVHVEVQPTVTEKDGKHLELLPSKALGLPKRYHRPWGGRYRQIFVLPTEQGTIWGITGEILRELIIFLND